MANTQEFVTVIKLNDAEAKNNLEQLKKKVQDLTSARNKAIAAGSDSNWVKDLNKDLKAAKAELKAYDTNVRKTIQTLDNLSTSSLEDVKKAMRALKKQMDQTTDPADYRRLNNLLDQCKERVNEFTESVGQSRAEVRKMADETQIAANALKNLNTASVSDLRITQSSLENRMASEDPNSAAWSSYNEQLLKVKARLQEIAEKQKVVNTIIDQYNKELEEAGQESRRVASNTQLIERTMRNLSTASVRDLETSLKLVNQQLQHLDRGSKEFKAMQTQAKLLRTELERVRTEGAAQKSWISGFADWTNRMQSVIVGAIASITGISMTVRKCVSDFAQMDQAMTDVQKYTGQTKEEVREMNETFKEMDTRTPREKLNALAGDAGRLGITSRDAIEEFVDAADKINVALGDDLGDNAVRDIGKLAEMFGESERMGLRGAMLATGSAVNELAQSSSAAAGYLVDFTARVSGVGKQAGLSQQQIMGFASVLDQNMQQDETSATAFQNLLTKMFQDPAKFAKLAGENVKEFSTLLKTDANQAILQFLAAMKSKGGFAELAPMFEEMAMDGSRATGVLTVMADKLGDIKEAQQIANDAYREGTSVLNEFNVQMESEQARLDMASKEFKEISIDLGEKLLPVARYTISTASLLVKGMSAVVSVFSKYGVTIASTTAAIILYTAAVNRSIIADKLKVVWTNYIIASFKKLWTVVKAHPYGALIAAVTLVTGVIIDLMRSTDKMTKTQEALNEVEKRTAELIPDEVAKLESLHKIVKDSNRSVEDRRKAIAAIHDIMPEYNASIDEEGQLIERNTAALKDYIKQLHSQAKAKAQAQVLQEKYVELQKKEAEIVEQEKKVDKYKTSYNNADPNNTGSLQGLYYGTLYTVAQTGLSNLKKEAQETKDAIDALNKTISVDAITGSTTSTPSTATTTTTGTGMSDKDRKAAEKAAKAAAAAKKKAMNEELKQAKANNDALQAENILAYQQGLKSYRDFSDQQHQITIQGIDDRIAIYQKYGEEYKQLSDERAEAELSAEQAHNNLLLADVERRYQMEVALAKQAYSDKSSDIYMNEAALNERLFEAEMSALADRMALQKEYSEDWLNTKAEMEQRELDHSTELQEYYAQQLAQYRQEWGRQDIETQKTAELEGLEDLYEKKLISEKEYQEMRKAIELQYASQQPSGSSTSAGAALAYSAASNMAAASAEPSTGIGSYLMSDVSMYQSTMEQLDSLYAQNLVSHEEYEQAKLMASQEALTGMVSKAQAAYNSINSLLSGASSYYAAQSQYEQNVTTAKYDKLIEAAGDNTTKAKKLEEKKEKELAKIKTKYNKKAMKIEIAQAIATNALSAMNAYASVMEGVPYPANMVLAPVAAGIAAAAGLLQIATIKKQHEAEEAGYYSGGFTGGANYRREAGVVHEGEFVANHNAVNNASILPALQLIDQAQRNNTVGSLTAADVSRSLGQGGATVVSAPSVTVQADNEELRGVITNMNDSLLRLQSILEAGIVAEVSIDGQRGVAKQLERFNKLKNNT